MTLEKQLKAQQKQIEDLFKLVKELRGMLGEQYSFRHTDFFMMDIRINEIQENIENNS